MATENIHILGLGNILCGDDGFGCHAIALLQETHLFPPNVNLLDIGTQSQLLPGILHDADRLLLFDAADFGQTPGALFTRSHEEIPAWLAMAKLSAHQGSFAEALAHARLLGTEPREIFLVGFQPLTIAFGQTASPPCAACLEQACKLALERLRLWGVTGTAGTGQAQAHPQLRNSFMPLP